MNGILEDMREAIAALDYDQDVDYWLVTLRFSLDGDLIYAEDALERDD